MSVGVIFGGDSTEHEISCISAYGVISNIDREKYNVYKIGILKDGKWFVYDGPESSISNMAWETDSDNLIPAVISPCSAHHGVLMLNKRESRYEIKRLDCVFPVLHGKNGEDGTMQGLLKIAGIPFVGCGTLSSAISMDKAVTKVIADSHGIKQTPWLHTVCSDTEDMDAVIDKACAALKFPIFVKPANAGSSVGISRALSRGEVYEAVRKASAVDGKIIFEQGVKGRELEVAVFEDRGENGEKILVASKCGEIIPENGFYDYDAKYVSDTKLAVPAQVSDELNEKIGDIAKKIFRMLGCRSLSRVDFFLDESGELIFNEINTMPGFTGISMYPKLMEVSGVSYPDLIDRLITNAVRFPDQGE